MISERKSGLIGASKPSNLQSPSTHVITSMSFAGSDGGGDAANCGANKWGLKPRKAVLWGVDYKTQRRPWRKQDSIKPLCSAGQLWDRFPDRKWPVVRTRSPRLKVGEHRQSSEQRTQRAKLCMQCQRFCCPRWDTCCINDRSIQWNNKTNFSKTLMHRVTALYFWQRQPGVLSQLLETSVHYFLILHDTFLHLWQKHTSKRFSIEQNFAWHSACQRDFLCKKTAAASFLTRHRRSWFGFGKTCNWFTFSTFWPQIDWQKLRSLVNVLRADSRVILDTRCHSHTHTHTHTLSLSLSLAKCDDNQLSGEQHQTTNTQIIISIFNFLNFCSFFFHSHECL